MEETQSLEAINIAIDLALLKSVLDSGNYPSLAPQTVNSALRTLLDFLQEPDTLSKEIQSASGLEQEPGMQLHVPLPLPLPVHSLPSETSTPHLLYPSAIKLNRQTTVERVYWYPKGYHLEYPETSTDSKWIGHLFDMDVENWIDLEKNIVYSQGEPRGFHNKIGKNAINIPLLKDSDGNPVPCTELHWTCQGVKVCPFGDRLAQAAPHTSMSSAELAEILKLQNSDLGSDHFSPECAVYEQTFAFFTTINRSGCPAAPVNNIDLSTSEQERRDSKRARLEIESRGQSVPETCTGRILFERDTTNGQCSIRCEYYNYFGNRSHLFTLNPGNGSYDMTYLEALFCNNIAVTDPIEKAMARKFNMGPYMVCKTVFNCSSVKAVCPMEHRYQVGAQAGELTRPLLERLGCKARFRLYQPVPEYRKQCPRALIICQYAHEHPPPTPATTPPHIKSTVLQLIRMVGEHLPDLTPRRFLRHPIVLSTLKLWFPHIPNPMLLDLHPSLSNRDHLKHYIRSVQAEMFPMGTGWDGVTHLKASQDSELTKEDQYIRIVQQFTIFQGRNIHGDNGDPLRILICMTPLNSRRLLQAKYIQCDIGFKRVVGFKEFELGGLDAATRISVTYCRIFLNSQSADAHHLMFELIDSIVQQDTGMRLQWRHIHSPSSSAADAVGILHVAVDQHGGQAKGFGNYLVDVAKAAPNRPDLHEHNRMLHDLGPYDHLHRILRLCLNHYMRNIQSSAVPETVKVMMRSLACIRHKSWDTTIERIISEGGKPAKDWVADKLRSQFAFQAICWERSYIPLEIWQAGDATSNIIESLHQDVNREGLHCTLLSGVQKGCHFDTLKARTLQIIALTGIRPNHRQGLVTESVERSLKRKFAARRKAHEREDNAILAQNDRVRIAYQRYIEAEAGIQDLNYHNRLAAAHEALCSEINTSLQNRHTGSGNVGLLLPSALNSFP